MTENLPVIKLELNSGAFRIRTLEAIYEITVNPDSSLARVVEKVVEKETIKALPAGRAQESLDPFYKEISEELYLEIGKLARQLSLSIKDIPSATMKRGLDIEQTGIELEDAKGQLEDIVQMTEKATMDIMDLAESIQDDLHQVQGRLGSINGLDFMLRESPADDWGESGPSDLATTEGSLTAVEATRGFLTSLRDQAAGLREAITQLPRLDEVRETGPAELPTPAPSAARKVVYDFKLDVLFQTLYEMCTNETVKDHIKAMRTDQNAAFDTAAVLKALVDMAPNVKMEDNFFTFPISGILKALFQASKSEKYKQIIKKMNQTVANIFLDPNLDVEGEVREEAVPAEVSVQPSGKSEFQEARPGLPTEKIETLLAMIDEALALIEREEALLAEAGAAPAVPAETGGDFTKVSNEDREKIISSVEGTSQLIHRIATHITKILEALSFQDLSGQRILKIVRLIGDVQVQLLSLLVSFGSKIKHKEQVKTVTSAKDTEKMAQKEVDRMMERIASPPSDMAGPEAPGRLDQGAVNSLLAELGF
ncbi:MAG: protein phosphatase CheZ [Thermodesulfobacteriota bacterium]